MADATRSSWVPQMATARFQSWEKETTVTVTPSTPDPVVITDLDLSPEDDTIWIHVTSAADVDSCPWPWSYALLTWVTAEGRELGTTKIHGACDGEVFRIGVGRAPSLRTGSVRVYPRSYNLAWVNLGHPWTLTFKFQTGKSVEGAPALGTRATLGCLADLIDFGVTYAFGDSGFATVKLLPK